MMTSHSNEHEGLYERLTSLEAKIDLLFDIISSTASTQPLYSIKQVATDMRCSYHTLKAIWKQCSPDVPEPIRGARYSKRDVIKFKEAYGRFRAHA